MKKKYGELGLIDPKMAKTNLFTKWIVKAMEPGDSNFQLILRYSISRYRPQKNISGELPSIGSPTNYTKDLLAQGCGATLARHGRPW